MPRAIEDILAIVRSNDVKENDMNTTPSFSSPIFKGGCKIFLKASIYIIHMDKIFDLLIKKDKNDLSEPRQPVIQHYLDQATNTINSSLVNISERLILSSEDFYIAISDAYRTRKELGIKLNDRDIRRKSHFIITLSLCQKTQGRTHKVQEVSQLNVVELSGSEQAVNKQSNQTFQNIRQTALHDFVSKSFNSLSCHLMRLVQRMNKKSGENEVPLISDETETKLLGCLRNTLTN